MRREGGSVEGEMTSPSGPRPGNSKLRSYIFGFREITFQSYQALAFVEVLFSGALYIVRTHYFDLF